MKTKRILLPLLLLFVLLFSGCSFIRIQNVSEHTATLRVKVPDNSKSYIRTVRSGMIVDVFSSHGGRYTIEFVPSEQYLETLNILQAQISQRLFAERQTLTAEQVRILVENLNHIDALLAEVTENPTSPGCSGTVPDFDTVVATIAFNPTSNTFEANCGSGVE